MKLDENSPDSPSNRPPSRLRGVLVEREPGEVLSVELSKRTFLVATEHGVWRRSHRSLADAALCVVNAGADPRDGALAFTVIGDTEAGLDENLRLCHSADSLAWGPIPVAWLAALLGPRGIPVEMRAASGDPAK